MGRLLTAKGEKTVALEKKTTEFRFSASALKGQALIAEDLSYPVRESRGDQGPKGRMWWRPAARFATDASAQTPKLALDIVPTGESDTFRVYWNGEAQPKTKVEVVAASGWSREFTTDATGTVRAPLPWRGRYLLLTRRTEMTPGENKGLAYDFINYTSTLSLEKASGDPSPPAPPPATPHPVAAKE